MLTGEFSWRKVAVLGNNNTTNTMKTVFILGKVFSPPQARDNGENTAVIDSYGTVRVQDWASGGALTTCHALTEAQQEQVRSASQYSTIKL